MVPTVFEPLKFGCNWLSHTYGQDSFNTITVGVKPLLGKLCCFLTTLVHLFQEETYEDPDAQPPSVPVTVPRRKAPSPLPVQVKLRGD